MALYNLARMTTLTTGTGTITLGSAVSGCLTFADAGVQNGDTVTYAISDGANGEIGRGVYTASGTTLTRSVLKSTNSDAAISLSGNAQVFITAAAEDFSDRQPLDAGLTDIAGLTPTDGSIPIGDGEHWVAESGETARASLGLAIGTDVAAATVGQGKQLLAWIPASQMTALSGTSVSTVTFNTNGTLPVVAVDAASVEYLLFTVAMPSKWDEGSITYQVHWGHPSTTTNFDVVFTCEVGSFGDGDAVENNFANAFVYDSGGTTHDLYISPESDSITPYGSPSQGDLLRFIFFRNASHASDTLAVDAYLIGVKIFYTTNAATDD